MVAELCTTWPDQATPEGFAEVISIVDELEVLPEKLSLLARADAGYLPVMREDVGLVSSLITPLDRVAQSAEARNLKVVTAVEDGVPRTDPVLWATILHNLLGNAVSYAPEGSVIQVEASAGCMSVSNVVADLVEDEYGEIVRAVAEKSHQAWWRDAFGLVDRVGLCWIVSGALPAHFGRG